MICAVGMLCPSIAEEAWRLPGFQIGASKLDYAAGTNVVSRSYRVVWRPACEDPFPLTFSGLGEWYFPCENWRSAPEDPLPLMSPAFQIQ